MGGVPFHVLTALTLIVFAAAFLGKVRFWLTGLLLGAGVRGWVKVLSLLPGTLQVLGRPAVGRRLFWNAVVQRQIWWESPQRWLIHSAISWTFVGLFLIGSLGNMFHDLGWLSLEKDTPWFAVINDALGLLLLLGVLLALARRWAVAQPYVRTVWDDAVILLVLAVLAFSGFLSEASRYLNEATPASTAQYAFLGYALSRLLEPLGLDWAAAHNSLWWAHAAFGLALVVYIPYSKLLHIFTSPATIALSASADEAGRHDEVTAWPRPSL